METDESFKRAIQLANQFADIKGQRPRIMFARMIEDINLCETKQIASNYIALGFDVDFMSLFKTSTELVKKAIENNVNAIAVSSFTACYKYLVPLIISELKLYGHGDIAVIIDDAIPAQDYQYLFECGTIGIFGNETKTSDMAVLILKVINQ